MWSRNKPPAPADAAEIATLAARLAVFLQAGLSPPRCWEELSREEAVGVSARRLAAEVHHQLEQGASHPRAVAQACAEGSEPERVFSALIHVAHESGTPLSAALWALAEGLRDRVGVEADIAAITQAPRQTTWLLLGLPPLSVVIAGSLGVDALGFLTGSPFGWLLLGCGTAFYALAIGWMRRLVIQLMPAENFLSPARDLLAVATQGGALPEVAEARVERVLAEHRLASGDIPEVRALTALSRRAGIPIAQLAKAEATWQRHQTRAEAAQAAQALSVRILIPLGLFVLPAFVMVGVVPVVFSLLEGALRSGVAEVW